MSVTSAIAIYFIVWWLCLFVVLPWGVRTQQESGDIAHGTEPSAPARPRLLVKFAITTVLAAAILGILQFAVSAGVTIDDIPFLPRF